MAAWKGDQECAREIAPTPEISVNGVSLGDAESHRIEVEPTPEGTVAIRKAIKGKATNGKVINGNANHGKATNKAPADHAREALPLEAAAARPGGNGRAWTSQQPAPERRLAAGFTVRLNLAVDLLLLSGVVMADGLTAVANGHVAAVLPLTLLAGAVWATAGVTLGYYDESAHNRDSLDDAILVATMLLATMLSTILFHAVVPHSPTLGRDLLFCWPAAVLIRAAFFRPAARLEKPEAQALIVGTGPLARVTGEDLARRGRQHVVGYLFFPGEQIDSVLVPPLLGTFMDLENALRTKPVSEVYIATDGAKSPEAVQHAISVCENLGIPFALPAYTFRLQRARPLLGKAIADGYLHYSPVEARTHERAVKRIFDVMIALAALWLLAPLFVVVAILIKATSRGPVFFKQMRCGLHGKPFEMLKFRSMVADAEQRRKTLEMLNERSGPVFKLLKDPRVTRIGAVIRKYSIDELPQLINVLRGDMSIVGPRPPIPAEVAKYEPWQLRRLSVRPGLTCLWQISPDRHRTSFEEWMYLDLQYVDHWNLLKDAEIIVRTFPVVFSGSGEPAKGAAARYNLDISHR